MKLKLLLLFSFASIAFSQAVQYSVTFLPLGTLPGNYPPNFISQSTVAVNGTTYTDATATVACPGGKQIVLPGTNTCVVNPSANNTVAFWMLPGNYSFTLQLPSGQFIGPFNFTASGSGPSPALQFPPSVFVKLISQLPPATSLNINYTYLVTNGVSSSDCTVGGGSFQVWCASNGSTYTAIGGSSSSIPTLLYVPNYNFSPITPGGSIAPGNNTITLTPVPKGMNGSDIAHNVWLSGGTGTAEACLITGGTGIAGSSSGQFIINCTNSHTGAWTLGPASFGLAEALQAQATLGGAEVSMPAGSLQLLAPTTVTGSNLKLHGVSPGCCGVGTWIHRTYTTGDSLDIGTSTTAVNNIELSDFTISQDINYIEGTGSSCGTVSNKPISGANIHEWGTNKLNIQRLRLENMVQNMVLSGGSPVIIRDTDFYGLWDAACSATQVTQTDLLINQLSSGPGSGLPTYITDDNSTFTGYATVAGTYTGAGARQHIEIDAGEDISVINSSIGGAAVNNVLIAATNPYALLNVRIESNKFDSAGGCDLAVSGDGVDSSANVVISNNIFNGELAGSSGFCVPNLTTGAAPTDGLILNNNKFWAYLGTPVSILDGLGFTVSGNMINYYNATNANSTPATSSGIYFGGRAQFAAGAGNLIGGGRLFENFGVGSNHTNYGLSLQSPNGTQGNIIVNWQPPNVAALQFYTPTLSTCGTSPAIYTNSTSNAGFIVSGSGTATGCVINFIVPFSSGSSLSCTVTSPGGASPVYGPVTYNTLPIVAAPSTTYYWRCN